MRHDILFPSDRVIVGLDVNPTDLGSIRDPRMIDPYKPYKDQVDYLLAELSSTNVYMKLNNYARIADYGEMSALIQDDYGMRLCLDFKLVDIPATLARDATLLRVHAPDMLTVMCAAGEGGMKAIMDSIGSETEVLGVTVLTSMDDRECWAIYGRPALDQVLIFAEMALKAGLDGLVCSTLECAHIKDRFPGEKLTLNVAGARSVSLATATKNDESRGATIADAVTAYADRFIIGRPIIESPDPAVALQMVLDEINELFIPLENL